jgi:hypothetical protein
LISNLYSCSTCKQQGLLRLFRHAEIDQFGLPHGKT